MRIICTNFSSRNFVCGGGLQNLTSLTVVSCSSIDVFQRRLDRHLLFVRVGLHRSVHHVSALSSEHPNCPSNGQPTGVGQGEQFPLGLQTRTRVVAYAGTGFTGFRYAGTGTGSSFGVEEWKLSIPQAS
jgi:hypothetical protein